MIIWLASFPRSGNTLLRTVLKTCFSLGSFDEDRLNDDGSFFGASGEKIGALSTSEEKGAFLREADAGPETVFIKTHRTLDSLQRAIYVVRDGRSAIYSYYRFLLNFHPESGQTLSDTIMGFHAYPRWCDHLDGWLGERNDGGEVLRLNYTDLVTADQPLLEKIAAFIGYRGPIQAWQNPFENLQRLSPRFFRAGRVEWAGEEGWGRSHDLLFECVHGPAMRRHGLPYDLPLGSEADDTLRELGPEISHLYDVFGTLFRKIEDKEKVIRKLRTGADKRLRLVRGTGVQIEAKERVIKGLKAACDERLRLLQDICKKAKARLS